MSFIFPIETTQIKSQKTGKIYILIRADKLSIEENEIRQIVKVCDEPEIFDNVFADIFKGRRYTEDNARMFIKLISEGQANENRFDWFILHEGEIVGTIGIKSLEGEIGYWQSRRHPGVMTLVTQTLCGQAKEAGFTSLWAYVKRTNIASIKVLVGAGFKLDPNLTSKRDDIYCYRILF